MTDEERPMDDGHKYDAPEPKDETTSRAIAVGVLAALVILLMVLVATGTVQIFDA